VLTASAKFMDTLQNIVKGLNRAGFSDRDYKLADNVLAEAPKPTSPLEQLTIFTSVDSTENNLENDEDITFDIDTDRILITSETPSSLSFPQTGQVSEGWGEVVIEIEKTALQQNDEFEKTVATMDATETFVLPTEIQQLVKTYNLKEVFSQQAELVNLPQFYLKVPGNDLFGVNENEFPLEKENLLEGFALSKADTNIAFDSIASELYKVDLDETKKEHTPTFVRLDGSVKASVMTYILDPSKKGTRVKNFTKRIMDIIGNMYPIPDKEIERYVNRVLEDFSDEQFADLADKEYSYTDKIKQKIKSLSDIFAEKKFKDFLDTDKVFIKQAFTLPKSISPALVAKDITKSLYEKEGSMNGFEERVINEIGNMSNIAFWTRNIEKRGFRINGFVNHYPDFIIYTKSGKTILLETKGDHLDAEQKIRLGSMWASKAGNNYRYFMVYEKRNVTGAYNLEEFLNIIREIPNMQKKERQNTK